MSDYRVNLDVYNGPLDLLLYLIRRDEVDIYDIPIARVTEQYVKYVELLTNMNPNLAGDFLVMAATLMEIKTRMLLPTVPAEDGETSDLEIDPRAELVRQLLEYKAFKDAAGDLRGAAETQAQRFPRRPSLPEIAEPELDLEDVQIWDLLEAFNGILKAIGADKPTHQVIYDDTPIELHAADILDRLGHEGPLTFRKIFEGRTSRPELLGLFLAVLELVRLKKILAKQEGNFGEIHIDVNPDAPAESEQGHALTPANLDMDLQDQEEQAMVTQEKLEVKAAAATDEETTICPVQVIDQEDDEDEDFDEDFDDDDEDWVTEDEDFDEDFDDDFDEDFDEDDEDGEEDVEDSAKTNDAVESGQYIADTHISMGNENDPRTEDR